MQDFRADTITAPNSPSAEPAEPLKRLACSSVNGDNVINSAGEGLGKIKDTREGGVEYVIIEFGGFLGPNQKYLAVPSQALPTAKENRHAFIMNETRESLKRYAQFNKGHWPDTGTHVLISRFK